MAVPESSPLITTVSQWQFLLRIIRENQRFFLTGHVRPDGDTVGSELALASLLSRLGSWLQPGVPQPPLASQHSWWYSIRHSGQTLVASGGIISPLQMPHFMIAPLPWMIKRRG